LGGFFITFEGIEGSGKTTQLSILTDRLSKHGLSYLCSKEPGGTDLGKELRSLLLTPRSRGKKWCLEAELLLFYADRAQHVETVIKPALMGGQLVILDRFEDSTRAYQGAQGISEKTLTVLRQIVLKTLRPDLTLLFDAEPEKMLSRANSRNREKPNFTETRFDQESLCFHRKVRKRFLEIASTEPERVCIVAADGSMEAIADNVWSLIVPKLNAAGFSLR